MTLIFTLRHLLFFIIVIIVYSVRHTRYNKICEQVKKLTILLIVNELNIMSGYNETIPLYGMSLPKYKLFCIVPNTHSPKFLDALT